MSRLTPTGLAPLLAQNPNVQTPFSRLPTEDIGPRLTQRDGSGVYDANIQYRDDARAIAESPNLSAEQKSRALSGLFGAASGEPQGRPQHEVDQIGLARVAAAREQRKSLARRRAMAQRDVNRIHRFVKERGLPVSTINEGIQQVNDRYNLNENEIYVGQPYELDFAAEENDMEWNRQYKAFKPRADDGDPEARAEVERLLEQKYAHEPDRIIKQQDYWERRDAATEKAALDADKAKRTEFEKVWAQREDLLKDEIRAFNKDKPPEEGGFRDRLKETNAYLDAQRQKLENMYYPKGGVSVQDALLDLERGRLKDGGVVNVVRTNPTNPSDSKLIPHKVVNGQLIPVEVKFGEYVPVQ